MITIAYGCSLLLLFIHLFTTQIMWIFKYLEIIDLLKSNVPILVDNTRKLEALQKEILTLAIIMGLFFLIISIIAANLIPFEGGVEPKDARKRRRWFWGLNIFSVILYLLYNIFLVGKIVKANLHNRFITYTLIGAGIIFMMYWLLGFLLSRFGMPRSKYGTIFPYKNKK